MSRLACVSSWAAQASYDLTSWIELLGPQPGATGWVTTKLHRLGPAEMQAHYDEVAAITRITPDDPPTFFHNSYSPGPPKDQGSCVHHPKHHDALAGKLVSAGVAYVKRHSSDYRENGLVFQDAARRELVDFFLEQFGMPVLDRLKGAARTRQVTGARQATAKISPFKLLTSRGPADKTVSP